MLGTKVMAGSKVIHSYNVIYLFFLGENVPDCSAQNRGQFISIKSAKINGQWRVFLCQPPQVLDHGPIVVDVADDALEDGCQVHDVLLQVLVDAELAVLFATILTECTFHIRLGFK